MIGTPIQRREFITFLGGAAAAWPLAARAQQAGLPVVGFLYTGWPEPTRVMAPFVKGLDEMGYADGRNIVIEYQWANNESDRLPELADSLVRRRVAVIAASPIAAALAAKAATSSIPVVFFAGADAVQVGLVTNLSRPGGNITGINTMSVEVGPKRFGLLHELLPGATRFGVLVNPNSPASVLEPNIKGAQAAAASIGRPLEVFFAGTSREIDLAFANLVEKRVDALMVTPYQLFVNRRVQLATLAARHAVPTIYSARENAEVGGLMSYSASTTEQYRQVGIYVGRILKGEKPADLPVLQPTKFEFVINLQTARTLGIEVPATLLAIADEVIE